MPCRRGRRSDGRLPRQALFLHMPRNTAVRCRVRHRSRLGPQGPCRGGRWSVEPVRLCGRQTPATAGPSRGESRGTGKRSGEASSVGSHPAGPGV
eukprot:8629564-Lingulodinium_polyedra.AAC.1